MRDVHQTSERPRAAAGDAVPEDGNRHDLPDGLDDPPVDREAEIDAALRFLLVPGVGLARLRHLRVACGGFVQALATDARTVAEALRIAPAEADGILSAARASGGAAETERRVAERMGVGFRLLSDADYPELLRASPDPPELLFVRGELGREPEPAVAIVGSRRASAYGCLQAGTLAVSLAERGVTVVSGGARGIDSEAHRGALRAGARTIAVLATGFAHPYPSEHAGLFDSIAEGGGALVTEQPSFVTARPDLFPRRNRVIAALSLVTVVVEAATRSGALLTARIAVDDLSRDAGCVPGPVTSPMSAGCHRAIREGWASLVTSADDVVEMLQESRMLVAGAQEAAGRARERRKDGGPRRLGTDRDRAAAKLDGSAARSTPRADLPSKREGSPGCSVDATSVIDAVRRLGRAGFDELERELAWTVPRIAAAALELELRGMLARDAEGAFRAKSR